MAAGVGAVGLLFVGGVAAGVGAVGLLFVVGFLPGGRFGISPELVCIPTLLTGCCARARVCDRANKINDQIANMRNILAVRIARHDIMAHDISLIPPSAHTSVDRYDPNGSRC